MFGRNKNLQKHPTSIDRIAAREETARLDRITKEKEHRYDLAEKLGKRAINGEPFGLKGFMAIGFPHLDPKSQKYRNILATCTGIQSMASGTILRVGGSYTNVYGIKSNAGDKGLSFEVSQREKNQENMPYYVTANVLCSRAIYARSLVKYGSEDDPYEVYFIDTSINEVSAFPVRKIASSIDDSPEHRSLDYSEYVLSQLRDISIVPTR